MRPVLLAVVPVFLVIVLGAALRRLGFPGDAFWREVNRLNYYILFPALLVHTLARAQFHGSGIAAMLAATAFGILATALLLILVRPLLRLDGPAFTSVFQGAVRQNTFIGLAAAASLYGAQGLTLSAVLLAGYVPLVNPLCIAVLVRFGSRAGRGGGGGGEGGGLARMIAETVKNPIPIACAIGLFLAFTGMGLPFGSAELLGILAQASLALGLLATGAGLEG
ncbi:MAG: AEC family transporter, partial [Alphaproteobacteria bacterium]